MYAIQDHTVKLTAVNGHRSYGAPDQVELSLVGTEYARLYDPVDDLDGPPTIEHHLPPGAVTAFVTFWELATEEQRAELWLYDTPIKGGRHSYHMIPMDRDLPSRHKWAVRELDETPRELHGVDVGDGWHRIYSKDLARALKGTRQAVRIGTATVKPSILRQLAKIHGPLVELKDENGALGFRSVDKRHRCTVRHGAGDRYAGRNGFEAIIAIL